MTIEEFLKADHEGHLEHSAAELLRHADLSNGLTTEARQAYFSGITTVFPLMLLSHYYEWLTGKDPSDYMERFVPDTRSRLQPQTDAMLETLYHTPDNAQLWTGLASSYLSTVPYFVLRAFAAYALPADQVERAERFIRSELAETIPALVRRLADCGTDPQKRAAAVVYLGGDYPFELLGRFHRAVIAPEA